MKIAFDDLELAFGFVSSDIRFTNTAYLSKTTGEIYYQSAMMDSDEIPGDVENADEYIEIPHKNDLGLGKKLVRKFVVEFIPEQFDQVEIIFSRKGAYGRFKDFLAKGNMLEKWYQYEEEKFAKALKDWCKFHEIEVEETAL